MKRERKPVFDPKAFLTAADGGRTISTYRKDQLVFTQGEPADAVFYIQQGKVKITVVSKQGKEAIVAMLGPGDFFGEGCLAGQPRRLATVAAMTECVEPISKSPEEDNKAGELDKAEEVLGVVLPADEDATLPWRISARKANLSRSLQRSTRRPSRK